MIGVEDWAEIRRLHRAEGLSINEIVRRRGLARNTVRAALRSERPPLYERMSKGSIVDAVDGELRALLAEHPRMPATVLAERIGWTRGMTVFKQRVNARRKLRGSRTRSERGGGRRRTVQRATGGPIQRRVGSALDRLWRDRLCDHRRRLHLPTRRSGPDREGSTSTVLGDVLKFPGDTIRLAFPSW